MKIVNTHEAKTQLSSLLTLVSQGEVVKICRNGKPIADLIPCRKDVDPLQLHSELQGTILYDPTTPSTKDEWPEEYR